MQRLVSFSEHGTSCTWTGVLLRLTSAHLQPGFIWLSSMQVQRLLAKAAQGPLGHTHATLAGFVLLLSPKLPNCPSYAGDPYTFILDGLINFSCGFLSRNCSSFSNPSLKQRHYSTFQPSKDCALLRSLTSSTASLGTTTRYPIANAKRVINNKAARSRLSAVTGEDHWEENRACRLLSSKYHSHQSTTCVSKS